MEAARGRTIVLHEIPDHLTRVHSACGLRLKTPATSFVLYRRRPTAYQTQHVILHELCHEWFDHGTSLDGDQLRRLLPVFDASLIGRVLGRDPDAGPPHPATAPPRPRRTRAGPRRLRHPRRAGRGVRRLPHPAHGPRRGGRRHDGPPRQLPGPARLAPARGPFPVPATALTH
ncbi:hypothetical protein ACFQVA_21075 [Actinomadura keratinilytica]